MSGLALAFIGPSASEVGVQAVVLFVFEVALIAGAFGASARGYSDAQNECCEDGFESGFHNDVV